MEEKTSLSEKKFIVERDIVHEDYSKDKEVLMVIKYRDLKEAIKKLFDKKHPLSLADFHKDFIKEVFGEELIK